MIATGLSRKIWWKRCLQIGFSVTSFLFEPKMSRKEIFQQLESWGEPEVRRKLENGELGGADSPYQNEVLEWLKVQSDSRSEARLNENLWISRQSLRNRTWAMIIAIVAIIYSARSQLIELFSYVASLVH